jgi:NAD(P)H-dependent FMN reductase
MAKILVFAGSTRTGSFNRKLVRAATESLENAGLEVTLAELGEYPMPIYDGDLETAQGLPEGARKFKDLLATHDGFLLASPEYNGFFPAVVKNLIDWVSRPQRGEKPGAALRGKVAALASASPAPSGGVRGLRSLRELLGNLAVTVIPEQVTIPKAFEAFDAEGRLARREDKEALDRLAADLSRAVTAPDSSIAAA